MHNYFNFIITENSDISGLKECVKNYGFKFEQGSFHEHGVNSRIHSHGIISRFLPCSDLWVEDLLKEYNVKCVQGIEKKDVKTFKVLMF